MDFLEKRKGNGQTGTQFWWYLILLKIGSHANFVYFMWMAVFCQEWHTTWNENIGMKSFNAEQLYIRPKFNSLTYQLLFRYKRQ